MRSAMPQPCIGSRANVLRISTSSVPCSRSVDGGMFPSIRDSRITRTLVDCQGEGGAAKIPLTIGNHLVTLLVTIWFH